MYILPSVFILALTTFGLYHKGFEQRYSPEIVKMEQAINSFANESRQDCHSSARDSNKSPSKNCHFGYQQVENTQATDIFVIGDSHANHLVPFIESLAEDAKLVGQDYTLDQCIPVFDLYWGGNSRLADKCKKRNDLAREHIEKSNFRYVILAGSWPNEQTKNIYSEGKVLSNSDARLMINSKFSSTIETIIKSGATPIVFKDTPVLNGKSPKCPIKKLVFNENLDCSLNYTQNKLIDDLIANIILEHPKVIILEPSEIFCSENQCNMSLKGIPLYRDADHLNEIGSKLMGNEYLITKPNPFL